MGFHYRMSSVHRVVLLPHPVDGPVRDAVVPWSECRFVWQQLFLFNFRRKPGRSKEDVCFITKPVVDVALHVRGVASPDMPAVVIADHGS